MLWLGGDAVVEESTKLYPALRLLFTTTIAMARVWGGGVD